VDWESEARDGEDAANPDARNSLKPAINTALWMRQQDDRDIDSSGTVDGTHGIDLPGETISQVMLDCAPVKRVARLPPERVGSAAGQHCYLIPVAR
jgi:hypothetical protein